MFSLAVVHFLICFFLCLYVFSLAVFICCLSAFYLFFICFYLFLSVAYLLFICLFIWFYLCFICFYLCFICVYLFFYLFLGLPLMTSDHRSVPLVPLVVGCFWGALFDACQHKPSIFFGADIGLGVPPKLRPQWGAPQLP